MKPDPRIFDDLTRVAGGAMNVFSGIREQILNEVRARFDEMAARIDLVPREDFDRLEARVNALQKRLNESKSGTSAKKAAASPKKSPAKKSGKKK